MQVLNGIIPQVRFVLVIGVSALVSQARRSLDKNIVLITFPASLDWRLCDGERLGTRNGQNFVQGKTRRPGIECFVSLRRLALHHHQEFRKCSQRRVTQKWNHRHLPYSQNEGPRSSYFNSKATKNVIKRILYCFNAHFWEKAKFDVAAPIIKLMRRSN